MANCSNCGLQLLDGYFICFRCGQRQPHDSPLQFGPLSAHNRHKALIKWAGLAGLIVLAMISAVSVWPSAEPYTPGLPEPVAPTDSAGPEIDRVAFPDSVSTPILAPTAMPTQAAPPTPVSTTKANSGFIRLIDPLDDPDHYCVDVPGAGRGVRLQSALRAHTCKPIATAADELFMINHPNEGQIYMEAYDLCVEAKGAHDGSSLLLKDCSESQLQVFTMVSDSVRLGGERQDDLCLAVAAGEGIPTGAPTYLRRALTLESCNSIEAKLVRWTFSFFATQYCHGDDQSDSPNHTHRCGGPE